MHTLEEKLGYVFKNKALLENALQPFGTKKKCA